MKIKYPRILGLLLTIIMFAIFNATIAILFISIISAFFILIALFNIKNKYVIIINKREGGRLGDQIISYSKAKWLSYKYGIPFKLNPFKYSELFELSDEQHFTKPSYFFTRIFYQLFSRLVRVNNEEDLVNALSKTTWPTLFIVRLKTQLNEHKQKQEYAQGDYAWVPSVMYEIIAQNPQFGKELKKMLQPSIPITSISMPKDRITIAVHIRKGSGFDAQLHSIQYDTNQQKTLAYQDFYYLESNPNLIQYLPQSIPSFSGSIKRKGAADQEYPDKFPPEQYYAKQIQNLSNFLNDAPLYVYLFTDDKNPSQLIERIKKNINKPNIIYDCRKEENSHDKNIIDDLYSMATFDCLIRAGSCFAYSAQLLGNHKIIIYPLHSTWITNDQLFVDRIGVILKVNNLSSKKFGTSHRHLNTYNKTNHYDETSM